jgi:hypothetical protein
VVNANEFELSDLVNRLISLEKEEIQNVANEMVALHNEKFSRLTFQLNLAKSMRYGHHFNLQNPENHKLVGFAKYFAYSWILKPSWEFFKKIDLLLQKTSSDAALIRLIKRLSGQFRQRTIIRYGHLPMTMKTPEFSQKKSFVVYLQELFNFWRK